MKRIYVLIISFVFVGYFLLTACSSKNSQSAIENSPQSSVKNIDKTYSTRLKQYKSFLQNEIYSETRSDGSCYLSDFCNRVVPGKTEDGIYYALFDMTGDGLPELHVLTDISYSIHTIENNQLVTWYEGDRYNRPLNNGMILWKGASESGGDGYIVLDTKGVEVSCVWFGKSGNDYRFSTGGEDIKLSKNQWKKLKKPFLAIGSDKIIWKNIGNLDF